MFFPRLTIIVILQFKLYFVPMIQEAIKSTEESRLWLEKLLICRLYVRCVRVPIGVISYSAKIYWLLNFYKSTVCASNKYPPY